MALPPKPTSAATSNTAVAAAPSASPVAAAPSATGKPVLKKFGAARIGEGETATLVPTPKAAGLDLVELSKQFYNTFTNFAQTNSVKVEDVIAACADADKSQYPGHKDGRIAYATANTVSSLAKINGLLNKVRGLGGGAAMKAKIAEKDQKIAALEAKLAEILAKMG
jgi:hypothetical protein